MAIVQTMCTSFKAEVAQGLHNFTRSTGNVFKLALYVATANIGADTQTYTIIVKSALASEGLLGCARVEAASAVKRSN